MTICHNTGQIGFVLAKTLGLVLIVTFLAVGSPLNGIAQETESEVGVVEGRVFFKGMRRPVPYAQVRIHASIPAQEVDEQGRFRFDRVPPGQHILIVQANFIQDFSKKILVNLGKTTQVDCYVSQNYAVLDEVVVTDTKEPGQMARRQISREELNSIPGANNDVIRVVQNLPGVAMSGMVSGYSVEGLVIRGTGPEDSKYFFNGFEVPQLFHFGALISVINAELIENIVYYPGGFGVRYGGALGGVVEVINRKSRTDRFGGVVDLSTYSSYLMFEGPVGEKFSWAGAVRRSFIDFILPYVIPEDQASFTLSPRFYDYIAQLDYRPDPKHIIGFSFLGSNDHMGLIRDLDENEPFSPDTFEMMIGWHRANASWLFVPHARIVNSLSVNFLYYENDVEVGRDQSLAVQAYYPGILEDFSIQLGRWNELHCGLQAGGVDFTFSGELIRPPKEGHPSTSLANDDTSRFDEKLFSWGLDGYAEDVMDPAQWLRIVPGLRINYLDYTDEVTADPRLTVKFFPTEKSTIKTFAGIFHQWPGRDELVEDYGNPDLNAEVAYQGGGGFEYNFGQGYFLDVQGYYKHLDNLISPTGLDADVPYENTGRGYVFGAELLARKRLTDRLFGWLAYTYSESKRKDDPDSDWRYFDQDQRHNLILLASYRLGEQRLWKLGGKWQFSTGLPYTELESAVYNADTDSYIPVYSPNLNAKRRVPFHQLDVRLDKLWIFNTWTLNTYLDVQNVYWQKYPSGYRYNYDYSQEQPVSFPTFMPSFGVQARF